MTPHEPLRDRVEAALRRVSAPRADADLVDAGRIGGLEVSDEGGVRVELSLRPGDPPELASEVREAAAAVDGVGSVRVAVRAEAGPEADGDAAHGDAPGRRAEGGAASGAPPGGEPADEGPRPRPERADGRSLPVMGQGGGGASGASGPSGSEGPRPAQQDREAASRHPTDAPALPGVGRVVAVSSGKGGVGKSTVATNLAAAWADGGLRVGLLDADVYGPDIPTMFGVHEKPRMEDEEVVPLEAHGVKLMSLGFIVDEDTPAIWRGPIIQGIVRQFLQQVRWGELDLLVVDLPPGTGDAQLSLCQLVRVDGGIFVTTPQDVAVGGVLKGVRMFERLELPVTGVVENMRGFVCPSCGERHDIFGSGGGEKLAASIDVPFLGAIPLGTAVREEGDRGLPTVLGRPDSAEAEALRRVAAAARERMEADAGGALDDEAGAPDAARAAAGPGTRGPDEG
jgi:ATP-binding protein involved in chromosome partitioning